MARTRGRPSPADQVKKFDRDHGITSEQRKKGSSRAAVAVVVFLLVASVIGALVVPVLGMSIHGEQQGSGQVSIAECHATGLMRECSGVVTTWQGQGPDVGQRVRVLSRTPLVGTVEVVLGTATQSTTTKQQHDEFYDVHRFVPASAWIMPQWLRPIAFIVAGIVWLVLAWGLSRAVMMATVRGTQPPRPTGAAPLGRG